MQSRKKKYFLYFRKNIREVSTTAKENPYEINTAARENPCEAKKKKKKQIQQRAIKKIKRESEAKNSPLVLWKKSFVQSFVVF